MKKSISSDIILIFVAILVIVSFYIMLNQQRILMCSSNIYELKNFLVSTYENLKHQDAYGYIKIDIPEKYEYRIYQKDKDIFLEDIKCNVKEKLEIDINLTGEILSKSSIFMIKNSSGIFISANLPNNLDVYYKHIKIGEIEMKIPENTKSTNNRKKSDSSSSGGGSNNQNTGNDGLSGGGGSGGGGGNSGSNGNSNSGNSGSGGGSNNQNTGNDGLSGGGGSGGGGGNSGSNGNSNSGNSGSGGGSNNNQNNNQQSSNQGGVQIVLAFFRQYDGSVSKRLISMDELKNYVERNFPEFVNIYTTSFKEHPLFKDSSKYGYYISDKVYRSTALDFVSASSILSQEMPNIIQKYPDVKILILVFVGDGDFTSFAPAGGGAIYGANAYLIPTAKNFKKDIQLVVPVYLEIEHPGKVIAHETGHAIGLLADQYINGCYYDFIHDGNALASISTQTAKEFGIKCNYLRKDLGARPLDNIKEIINALYSKYGKDLLSLLKANSVEELAELTCLGNLRNGLLLVATSDSNYALLTTIFGGGIAVMRFFDNGDGIINTRDINECYVLKKDQNGKLSIEACYYFTSKYAYDPQYFYLNQINRCYANIDISGQGRDVMGNINMRYYSSESIEAYLYNAKKIWGI